MPEIKQPEQLSLGLEDTRKGLFINMEKLRNDIAMYDFNVLAFDAALVAGAPQPAGQREQHVNALGDWYMRRFDELILERMNRINALEDI